MNIDTSGTDWFKNLINKAKKTIKNVKKKINTVVNNIKKSFVFDAGVGVGLDVSSKSLAGGGIGYYKNMTYKYENNKKSKGSTTSFEATLSLLGNDFGAAKSYYHDYHYVNGDFNESINHSNILPFKFQIDDCKYTIESTTILFKTSSKGEVQKEQNNTFIGIDFSAHVGIGGHIKIGFNIP